jgi:ABC-type transport system involved in cytochrome c biogenesis permease component
MMAQMRTKNWQFLLFDLAVTNIRRHATCLLCQLLYRLLFNCNIYMLATVSLTATIGHAALSFNPAAVKALHSRQLSAGGASTY